MQVSNACHLVEATPLTAEDASAKEESRLLVSRLSIYLHHVKSELELGMIIPSTQIISEITKIFECPDRVIDVIADKILTISDEHFWDITMANAVDLAEIFILEYPSQFFILDNTLKIQMPDNRFEKWLKDNVSRLSRITPRPLT